MKKNVWQWWVRDVLGTKPRYGSSKVSTFDLVWAMFMTIMASFFALLAGFILLAIIIASKGIALVVFAIIGGAGYGLYKLIEKTAHLS